MIEEYMRDEAVWSTKIYTNEENNLFDSIWERDVVIVIIQILYFWQVWISTLHPFIILS